MTAGRPPRVLYVVPNTFGDRPGQIVGGLGRYARELARHMAEATPTTLVGFGTENRITAHGRLREVILGNPWYVRRQIDNPVHAGLIRLVARADVVHCFQKCVLTSSLAALIGRLTGRPVFVTDCGGGGWDLSAYVTTTRWYRGHLHLSEYSQQLSGHAGEPWSGVIYGGVDVSKFSPDPISPRGRAVLYVGRLLPHKGVDDLIEAATPDLPMEIIGRPYDMPFVTKLKHLASGKRVAFRHDCDDAGLVSAYRRALCVVLPSVYQSQFGAKTLVPELLGQTLLEGMACGIPAVCTAVGSMPEVVEDQVSGFVVPPNNPAAIREKIIWLRDHPEKCARMGAAARRRILERFTWPAVVSRCLATYTRAARQAT
jgi:glycosyltransferase involved in cell wall biosynthesis